MWVSLGWGKQRRGSWQHEWVRMQARECARTHERARGRQTARKHTVTCAYVDKHVHARTCMHTYACTSTLIIYRKTYCCKFSRADACEPRIMLLKIGDGGPERSIVNLCEYVYSCGLYRYRYKITICRWNLYLQTGMLTYTCRDKYQTVWTLKGNIKMHQARARTYAPTHPDDTSAHSTNTRALARGKHA